MREPLAYFLTWRTYGTWLHGDVRGAVDREHNAPGTPFLDPDSRREDGSRRRMHHSPVILSDVSRAIIEDVIVAHGRHRGWELHEVAVRTNHVHVVGGFAECPPERMMAEFKAWCTRRLRAAGLASADQPVWAYHGSTRYLWDAAAVESAMAYVRFGQHSPR